MAENTKAMAAMKKARSALLRGYPQGRGAFFGSLAMGLELDEDVNTPGGVMATNGRVIKFNPKVIEKMPAEHVLSIVAHEVLHVCSLHHIRRGNREDERWQYSCDFVVNSELKEAGFDLPEDALYDERFKGMSAERIYTLIDIQKIPQSGKGKGDFSGRIEDAVGEDGESPPTEEELQKEEQHWKMEAVKAAAAAQKMQGTLPAFAERLIADIRRPKVSPWDILRQFMKATQKNSTRWFPPSRRFVSRGLYLPSIHSEDQLGKIMVIVDTSGSIDEETLKTFGGHIQAIREDMRPRETLVMYCDAAVAPGRDGELVDRYKEEETLVLMPRGGGGTDFRPPFKWIDEHQEEEEIVAVAYLSDLQGPFPDRPSEVPTIWASTTGIKAPWGITVQIKE